MDDGRTALLQGDGGIHYLSRTGFKAAFSLPRMVYAGDMLDPHEFAAAAPQAWSTSFVYHVFGDDGTLLYVGFTGSPLTRWQRHQRNARWWSSVRTLHLYEVVGHDRNTADLGARHWEALAIHGALPTFNLHGPSTLPAKQVQP